MNFLKKGITLLEMIIMIIIAGIALPPLVSLLVHINTKSSTILPFRQPNTFAVELLEEIKGKKWDENWIGGPLDDSSKTSPSNLGPDSGETIRNDYDDIDDYNALTDAVITDVSDIPIPEYSDYRVSVHVYYIPGLTSDPYDFQSEDNRNPPSSNSKRIDITMTKGERIYEISTIVCNY